ncbi:MAG: hypothetical protein R3E95_18835 [Thiolinea sp.]
MTLAAVSPVYIKMSSGRPLAGCAVRSLQAGQRQGIAMRQGDLDSGCFFPRNVFDDAEVFWFMPPPPQGEEDIRLRRFLLAVQGAPRRLVLISTTGVYGDCGGRWIDEHEPLRPVACAGNPAGRCGTGAAGLGQRYGSGWVILRVPGIYAQDRLPLARLQRGEPVLQSDEAPWTNRIHADDLAQICQLAMKQAPAGSGL